MSVNTLQDVTVSQWRLIDMYIPSSGIEWIINPS